MLAVDQLKEEHTLIRRMLERNARALSPFDGDAMLHGAIAHRPWLESEFKLRVALVILTFVSRTGMSFFARRARDVKEILETIHAQTQSFGGAHLRAAQ